MDQILGGAANPAGAALHGIGPGSLRPVLNSATNTVTDLKQGSTQPAGHSFEATASMCWLQSSGVVPNDTKGGLGAYFVALIPSIEGYGYTDGSPN